MTRGGRRAWFGLEARLWVEVNTSPAFIEPLEIVLVQERMIDAVELGCGVKLVLLVVGGVK